MEAQQQGAGDGAAVLNASNWLRLVFHCLTCSNPQCPLADRCFGGKFVVAHIMVCPGPGCQVPSCASVRRLILHWLRCVEADCRLCSAVWRDLSAPHPNDHQQHRGHAGPHHGLGGVGLPSSPPPEQPGTPERMVPPSPYHPGDDEDMLEGEDVGINDIGAAGVAVAARPLEPARGGGGEAGHGAEGMHAVAAALIAAAAGGGAGAGADAQAAGDVGAAVMQAGEAGGHDGGPNAAQGPAQPQPEPQDPPQNQGQGEGGGQAEGQGQAQGGAAAAAQALPPPNRAVLQLHEATAYLRYLMHSLMCRHMRDVAHRVPGTLFWQEVLTPQPQLQPPQRPCAGRRLLQHRLACRNRHCAMCAGTCELFTRGHALRQDLAAPRGLHDMDDIVQELSLALGSINL